MYNWRLKEVGVETSFRAISLFYSVEVQVMPPQVHFIGAIPPVEVCNSCYHES